MRVREIEDGEGQRLLRIVRRGTGSVVTWRRVQMVLLSAQVMPVAGIAEVSLTNADRIRDVIHNFNTDSFDSLYPEHKGGRPKRFTLPERGGIKKIAKSRPTEHGLPFSTWSLTKGLSQGVPGQIQRSAAYRLTAGAGQRLGRRDLLTAVGLCDGPGGVVGGVDDVRQQVGVQVPAAVGRVAAEARGERGAGGEVLGQIQDTARGESAAPYVGQVEAVVVL